MPHIINYNNPNLVLLNGNTAVYFGANDNTFEPEDTVILQDGRSETNYIVETIYFNQPFQKKNTVMLNLTREEA